MSTVLEQEDQSSNLKTLDKVEWKHWNRWNGRYWKSGVEHTGVRGAGNSGADGKILEKMEYKTVQQVDQSSNWKTRDSSVAQATLSTCGTPVYRRRYRTTARLPSRFSTVVVVVDCR